MDKNQMVKQGLVDQVQNSLNILLFNSRQANDYFLTLQSLETISKLCQGKATLKFTPITCKLCSEQLEGRDEEIVNQVCECKTGRKVYFHAKCFLEYCLVNSESSFKCKNQECYKRQLEQIKECFNNFDQICKLCNNMVNRTSNDTVKAGCECPFKRVHKDCIKSGDANFKFKQHQLYCEDCRSYYREENIINVIQDYEFSCQNCYQQSNHIYWDCVPIECYWNRICRNCFEYSLSKIVLKDAELDKLNCPCKNECSRYLSFHTLHQYLYKTERVQNNIGAMQILETCDIKLENFFRVAECPGYVLTNTYNEQAYKFLQQENQTHYLLYGKLLNERELEDEFNECDGRSFILTKCNNKFEVNEKYNMQRCSNCNYKFCPDCHLPHFGITCSVFRQIRQPVMITDEDFISMSQLDNNMSDFSFLLQQLKLKLEVFRFGKNDTNIDQIAWRQTIFQQNYNFLYPLNNYLALQINVEWLYGQMLSAYSDWLFMYLPINDVDQLRQCITNGIERNLSPEIAYMRDKFTQNPIQYGRVLYSEFPYALDNSKVINIPYNGQEQPFKVLLLCKVLKESVKQPLSYESMYVSNQMIFNPQNRPPTDISSIIAYQILVFNQFN